MLLLADFS